MENRSYLPSKPKLLTALVLLVAALAVALFMLKQNPSGPLSSGTALIGGPFTMVNQKGETVTEKSFEGHFTLYFFGYTFCPDVCPTELQVVAAALNALGPAAANITPVFVSIDPERDTPAIIGAYVANFDPRLQGLTGTPVQVAQMARAFHVFYQKVPDAKNLGNYGMDHSSILYLMGPDGKFVKHFSYSTDAKNLSEDLKKVLEQ